MFSAIRKRLTYGNVAMTVALVFAMSGGAFAAGKFLITSTKQISPKVLKSLQGKAGPAGVAGAQGPAGPTGAQGPTGPAGTAGAAGAKGEAGPEGKEGKAGKDGKNGQTGFTETLPSGKTEEGTWAGAGSGEGAYFGFSGHGLLVPISFVIPLAIAPEPHVIGIEEGEGEAKQSSAIPGQCTGTVASPGAKGGQLCVFVQGNNLTENTNPVAPVITYNPGTGNGGEVSPMGAVLFVRSAEAAEYIKAGGTWAVTAE